MGLYHSKVYQIPKWAGCGSMIGGWRLSRNDESWERDQEVRV